MNDEVRERNIDHDDLEMAYKTVCEFEKSSYEKIYVDQDDRIVLELNKEQFLELENMDEGNFENRTFQPLKFPSYKSLFNKRYKDAFSRNVKAINPQLLKNEIGEDKLLEVIKQDQALRRRYMENIKEVDLDNDGIPDRIDIDDSRNSVQTVSDLNLVGNSTNKETERHKNRGDDLER
ncbi:hypothetical protein Q5W88_21590 [Shouchella clausii]|uniref:hypothetical protein n=1 Tax=Shouchella clausii TaxID=79880 RepID=UPI0026F45951|nr:hypothetical protein [Shouchella clausii]MDO7285900.1 hypothetical protein [Shouchella clausii]MDO7305803.1 hypothetical protein [Shouchella clausii]